MFKRIGFVGALWVALSAVAAMEVWEGAPAGPRLVPIPGVGLEKNRELFAADGKKLFCSNSYWPTDGHFYIKDVLGVRGEGNAPVSINRSGVSWRLLPGVIEEISCPRMNGTSYADGTYSSYAEIRGERASVEKCPAALALKEDWVQELLRKNFEQIFVSYDATAYCTGKSEREPWYKGTVTIDLRTLSIVEPRAR